MLVAPVVAAKVTASVIPTGIAAFRAPVIFCGVFASLALAVYVVTTLVMLFGANPAVAVVIIIAAGLPETATVLAAWAVATPAPKHNKPPTRAACRILLPTPRLVPTTQTPPVIV